MALGSGRLRGLGDRLGVSILRAVMRLSPRIASVKRWPGVGRIVIRAHEHWVRPAWKRGLIRRAGRYRLRLPGTTFIGITGSVGKSTTRTLLTAIVATRGPAQYNIGGEAYDIGRAVLATRPAHRFFVAEVGALGPDTLDDSLALLKVTVGVITCIESDHRSAFRTLDATAAEKVKLVRSLPSDGIAVLNADDPRVAAMATGFPGRVVTYGLSPGATVRAEGIAAAWPDRLAFTAIHEGTAVRVQTQMCGRHWVSSALAALAAGIAVGVPLADAARAIAGVEPLRGRMMPVTQPDGVTFIRDDWKASLASMAPALEFMREARALRKIAVIGSISDYPGPYSRCYQRVARSAREAADFVVFVGPLGFAALSAKRDARDESVQAFATARAASAHLAAFLRPGDLVLLKGSNPADHLVRLLLARETRVECWRSDCRLQTFCEDCRLLTLPGPEGMPLAAPLEADGEAADSGGADTAHPAGAGLLVVGLGNPGEQHRGTPHNVGHRVVDIIGETLGGEWTREDRALVCRGEWQGTPVRLVKPLAYMNEMGPALADLARAQGLGPERCVLVYDDVDLPPGAVRRRDRGSDGGHRGVRSILQAFQSPAFPRVKVGVGRPPAGQPMVEFLLSALPADRLEAVEGACREAATRVLELVSSRADSPSPD